MIDTTSLQTEAAAVFALIPLAAMAPLSPAEMAIWATSLSVVGGAAAAVRKRRKSDLYDIVRVALNTGALGASLALIGFFYSAGEPKLSFAIIGGCGVLSLAGMASINWAVELLRRKINKWLGYEDESGDS